MNHKLRILNLEDNAYDTELIQARLDEDDITYALTRVDTKQAYIRAVEEGAFDIILGDYSLPGFDGLRALEVTIEMHPEIPFIFVSGAIGEDLAIETLKRGATDYVLKSRLQRLGPAVRRAVLEAQEKAERRKAEDALRKAHAELERRVEERTADLFKFAISLQEEIRERKKAEEVTQHLKNYLANIIDSMPSALVGMDHDETVTQWNQQAEKLSGISAEQALGRSIAEMLPDFSPWIEALRSEIDQRRPASMEKLLIEKEGVHRFYDLMLYPLVANGVEGSVLRIEDTTERARIQQLMIQTEKMISIGGLAAGMAHEINNPLGIITQAAQNIEHRVSAELPASQKAAEELGINLEKISAYFEKRHIPELIGSIREASHRASRIIDNMLQFSRRAGATMEPASAAGIIDQALELAASDYDLRKKFDFKDIEIIRDYAPDMPEVPMVVVEIEQVMLNLLKNAVQAMTLNPPDSKPRIRLRLRREGRYALIEVEDNGPGMGEDIRRRVFEPFFTTKEPGIGTGLGLSVSYVIVTQNHKGLMEVESTPGKGACFKIRLPLLKESQL